MRDTSLTTAVVAVLLLFSTPSRCSIWRRPEPAGTPARSALDTVTHHNPQTSDRSLSTTHHNPSNPSELSPQSAAAWLQQASDPAHVFKLGCTEDDTSGWVDNCDILASSQQHKLQLSALLTVCQLQSSTQAHIPLECRAWLDGQAEVGRCIE